MFDLPDLVYRVVHEQPGGVPALAARMGVSPNVLNKKVSPTQEFHKLTLGEAAQIVELTGDDRIPQAFADMVGCVLVPTADFDGVTDMALLETYTQMISCLGVFGQDFHAALRDGHITRAEVQQIHDDLYKLQSAGAELFVRLGALIDD
ncbi:MAG: phage regulatory CII family protein [Sulfuriferula sp.]